MAHNTLIDGTAYEVNGGRTLVDGTGYGIDKGKTLVDGTGYDISFVSYDPVFANNDWSAIIAACQSRNVPDTWAVGNSKPMTINGASYQIDIIGKNHDAYADGSGKAPLTFQMHDSYTPTYSMNDSGTNSGGWASCKMRSTHLPAILALMPSEVRSAIREVHKVTSTGGGLTVTNTVSDKLFLLSEIEVCDKNDMSANGEGSRYEYYAAGNSPLKYVGGNVDSWWLRSPYKANDSGFVRIMASGAKGHRSAKYSHGVAFGFCF